MQMTQLEVDGIWTRPVVEDDLEALVAIQGDPATNEHSPTGPLRDHDAGRTKLASWIADWQNRGIGYWAVEQPSDTGKSTVIGFGGVHYIPAGNGEVFNLHYRFTPAVWGNGYASRLAGAARDLAAAHDPRAPVIARMAPTNRSSERVAQRIGLSYAGNDHWGRYVFADRELDISVLEGLPALPDNHRAA